MEAQFFAFRDKNILKHDSNDSSPDEWLEVYSVKGQPQMMRPTTELNIWETYHEKPDRTSSDESLQESFSDESDMSLTFQTSLPSRSDDMQTLDNLSRPQSSTCSDRNIENPSMIPTYDHKTTAAHSNADLDFRTVTQRKRVEESRNSIILPPLDSLPAKGIEISSRSSFLSCSSLNQSTELSKENVESDNRKCSNSEHFTESGYGFEIISATEDSSWLNKQITDFTNLGYVHVCSPQSESITINPKMKTLDEDRCPLSYVHNCEEVLKKNSFLGESVFLNETQSLSNSKHVIPENKNLLTKITTDEKDLNDNNVSEPKKISESEHLDKLPPLPPRRKRSRTFSTVCLSSTRSNRATAMGRIFTPPPSYQRHELLAKTSEFREEGECASPKYGFPYPCLVRFPSNLRKYEHQSSTRDEGNKQVVQNNDAKMSISREKEKNKETFDTYARTSEQISCKQETILESKPQCKKQVYTECDHVQSDIKQKEANSKVVAEEESSVGTDRSSSCLFSCCVLL